MRMRESTQAGGPRRVDAAHFGLVPLLRGVTVRLGHCNNVGGQSPLRDARSSVLARSSPFRLNLEHENRAAITQERARPCRAFTSPPSMFREISRRAYQGS